VELQNDHPDIAVALGLTPDRRTYDVIADRSEIVRQIFADSAAGMETFMPATQQGKQ
jgi:hypothetical protein